MESPGSLGLEGSTPGSGILASGMGTAFSSPGSVVGSVVGAVVGAVVGFVAGAVVGAVVGVVVGLVAAGAVLEHAHAQSIKAITAAIIKMGILFMCVSSCFAICKASISANDCVTQEKYAVINSIF